MMQRERPRCTGSESDTTRERERDKDGGTQNERLNHSRKD